MLEDVKFKTMKKGVKVWWAIEFHFDDGIREVHLDEGDTPPAVGRKLKAVVDEMMGDEEKDDE